MSLLIKNGIIVTASDIYNGDIYIDEGIIKEIVRGSIGSVRSDL